eukprot:837915-Pyramimonas_sp.AAC.1
MTAAGVPGMTSVTASRLSSSTGRPGRGCCGCTRYALVMDQWDAGRAGIFSRWTNGTQDAR